MSLVLRHFDRRNSFNNNHKKFQNIYYNNKYNTNYNHVNTKNLSKHGQIKFIYNKNVDKIFYDITVILLKKRCIFKNISKNCIIEEYFGNKK